MRALLGMVRHTISTFLRPAAAGMLLMSLGGLLYTYFTFSSLHAVNPVYYAFSKADILLGAFGGISAVGGQSFIQSLVWVASNILWIPLWVRAAARMRLEQPYTVFRQGGFLRGRLAQWLGVILLSWLSCGLEYSAAILILVWLKVPGTMEFCFTMLCISSCWRCMTGTLALLLTFRCRSEGLSLCLSFLVPLTGLMASGKPLWLQQYGSLLPGAWGMAARAAELQSYLPYAYLGTEIKTVYLPWISLCVVMLCVSCLLLALMLVRLYRKHFDEVC